MIYNINYNRLIYWLFPTDLRTAFNIRWLNALIAPVITLFGDFTRYRKDIEYRISITPQVCYLEKLLNDTFDPDQRRITITDSPEYLVQLIHTDEAQTPLLTYIEGTGYDDLIPVIHDDSAYLDGGADFNVNVPFSLSVNEENRMKSLLNIYKLASKRYKIFYA